MSNFTAKTVFFAALISVFSITNVLAQDAAGALAREAKVLADAKHQFELGLDGIKRGDRQFARDSFNQAVLVFRRAEVGSEKISACYSLMTDTVFSIEFPRKGEAPNIEKLARVCDWQLDSSLVASVKAAVLASAQNEKDGTTEDAPTGFAEQRHEVSPLDALAKLVLNDTETDVSNPTSQEQYESMERAVSSRSLGFTFQVHPMIQQFINYYQGRGRSTMSTGLYRSGMFMRMARRIFREEGVPESMVWLGQVESAWKPTALSWAAASGLWQFIPSTGERFGLRRTAYVDERNSFEAATRASARYLRFLANRYGGNWELAMAAYNSGEGNVDRAIARAGVANFWAAYPYLPQETRNYVPNILATIIIAHNPQQYGFGHIRPAAPLLYDRVKVPASTSLGFIAQASDTTVEYLRYLNPELRTNTTPPEAYVVRVPPTKGDEVVAMFRRVPSGGKDVGIVATAAGESWQNIANRTGVSVEELRAANPGMAMPQGKVIVPVSSGVTRTAYQRPSTPSVAPVTSGFRIVKVKKGDSLIKIASQYGVTASEIANLNGLSSVNAPLQAGRELKVPVK